MYFTCEGQRSGELHDSNVILVVIKIISILFMNNNALDGSSLFRRSSHSPKAGCPHTRVLHSKKDLRLSWQHAEPYFQKSSAPRQVPKCHDQVHQGNAQSREDG